MYESHKDFLYQAVLREHGIFLVLGHFTDLTNACCGRHHTANAGAEWLADAVCSTALYLGTTPGSDDKATVRFECEGPAAGCIIDTCGTNALRALPRNPSAGSNYSLSSDTDWETLCGVKGTTVEITRSQNGKILRTGKTGCSFLRPSMALGYFLSVSDGMETEICSAVSPRANPEAPIASADGLLIQAVPDSDLEKFAVLRDRIHEREIKEILVKSIEPEKKIQMILTALAKCEIAREMISFVPLRKMCFGCTCSREHIFAMAVRMLGKEDLKKLLKEKPATAMRCHFCGAEYIFTEQDMPGN